MKPMNAGPANRDKAEARAHGAGTALQDVEQCELVPAIFRHVADAWIEGYRFAWRGRKGGAK